MSFNNNINNPLSVLGVSQMKDDEGYIFNTNVINDNEILIIGAGKLNVNMNGEEINVKNVNERSKNLSEWEQEVLYSGPSEFVFDKNNNFKSTSHSGHGYTITINTENLENNIKIIKEILYGLSNNRITIIINNSIVPHIFSYINELPEKIIPMADYDKTILIFD